MEKITIPVEGMHCKSCEVLLENNIGKIEGVKKVEVSQSSKKAKIWYEQKQPSLHEISRVVEDAGYHVSASREDGWVSKNFRDYYYLANAVVILALLYISAQLFGFSGISADFNQKGLAVAVLVGLVAGISTCMALVGGLVLAFSARYSETHPEASRMQKFRPHIFFNLGRIIGFAVLGGLIGLIGGVLQPSARLMGVLTLIVGAVMVLLGLKLIEIFPALQRVNITIPKSVSRILGIKSGDKGYSNTSAFVGGVMTFFLPCGFTQAMQLYAISTGSFVQGALVMSLFALGTAPGMLSIGGLSSVFKGSKARIFFSAAGVAVIFLGIFNIANASRVVFPHRVGSAVTQQGSQDAVGPVQEVKMVQSGTGYSPNQFTVKKGAKVRWVINSTSQYTCASTLSMPAFGIAQPLKLGENVIEFTPTQTGEIDFSCSMGMYRGKFIVTD